VRLLLDECLHPRVAALLTEEGHDVVTVAGLGLRGATDPEVLSLAALEDRLLVTLDTDFGGLLVREAATAPSVILIRRSDHRPQAIAAVVTDVLASSAEALQNGALAVVGEGSVRLRELPLQA
jgi:predicted nuclease of predicted toxin-antitoxin system